MLPFIHFFALQISTYFLVISFTCMVCTFWFLARCEKRNLIRVTAIDMTLVCLIGGFVGARLLHVFWEDPGFYQQHPLAVLEIWRGGFVFLGGVLGAWAACTVFCVFKSEPFWFWADVAIPCISLGYAIGRIACFLNGCCYGRFCELPWAVALQGGMRHPTQLYATLWELCLCALLLKIEPKVRMAGTLFSVWLVLHALGRVMMEYFRDDPRGPMLYGISIGTWMSLAFGLAGLITLILRPGHKRLV